MNTRFWYSKPMIEARQLQVASSRGYLKAQTLGRAIKSIYPRNRLLSEHRGLM